MRCIPGLFTLRKCCSARTLPPKPTPQQWTRGTARISYFTSPPSVARQRAEAASESRDAGDRRVLNTSCAAPPRPLPRIAIPVATAATTSASNGATPAAALASGRAGSGAPPAAMHPRGAVAARLSSPPGAPMVSDVHANSVSAPALSDSVAAAPDASGKGTDAPPAPTGSPSAPGLGPPYDQLIRSDFLGPGPLPPGRRMYLVVLNYCLPAGLLHVWPLASFRICADGGCNRLHDELPSMMPPPPEEIAAAVAGAEAEAVAAGAGAEPRGKIRDASHIEGTAGRNGHSGDSSSNGWGHAHGSPRSPCHHSKASPDIAAAVAAADAAGPPLDVAAALRLAHMPDIVLGDLDSLRPDIRQFYVQHGVPFLDMSYDQDTNDLTKAINLIEERYIQGDRDPDHHQILVLGALGGRLDHTLANLNVLHMFPHLNIALWGDGNLVRLVRPGSTLITPDERFEGPTCGLIPIAGPVTATSSGMKWNVDATLMWVGGLVSSSNLLTGNTIEVRCDGPLLWSTEMRFEPRPDLGLWARTAAAAAAQKLGGEAAAATAGAAAEAEAGPAEAPHS